MKRKACNSRVAYVVLNSFFRHKVCKTEDVVHKENYEGLVKQFCSVLARLFKRSLVANQY